MNRVFVGEVRRNTAMVTGLEGFSGAMDFSCFCVHPVVPTAHRETSIKTMKSCL